jgi:hypothetical protein
MDLDIFECIYSCDAYDLLMNYIKETYCHNNSIFRQL